MERVITVATIEDRREIREGLAALIDGTHGFQCLGRYRSMEEALEGLRSRMVQLVLVDIELPGMSGIEGIRLLRERYPQLLLLMLTVYDDDDRIFEALCAGACGYLLKKTPPARLLESLREAVDGGAPMSPDVARRVITLFRAVRPPEKADYDLSPHEVRLLKLMVEGHSYRSAAGGVQRHGAHGLVPSAAHLRKTSGAHQVRSCRQGDPQPVGLTAPRALPR